MASWNLRKPCPIYGYRNEFRALRLQLGRRPWLSGERGSGVCHASPNTEVDKTAESIDCNRATDRVGSDGKPFGRRRLNRRLLIGEPALGQ